MLFRIISSLIILPALLWLMFVHPIAFRIFVVAGLLVGYEEYRRILQVKKLHFKPWLGMAALLAILLPPALGQYFIWPAEWEPFLSRSGSLGVAAFFMAAAVWRVIQTDLKKGLERFWAELAGLIYIGLLGLHVIKLNALQQGTWWTVLMFWYAWIYDSGALFIGKPFGKTKFSVISPGKTWEGFWGGIGFNIVLSGLVLPLFFPPDFPLNGWQLALLSVPASLLAQAGDLFESMMKRFAGVKDSSHLISKHGGFLDKMDSSLFVAPLLYLAALMVGAI
jgi:phosphatidate cytidylyltransferase